VLLFDSDGERAQALIDQLAGPEVEIVRSPMSADIVAEVARLAPDIIIVDMALPDRDALEEIRQVAATAPKPIILFADKDDPAFMEEAIAAGVSSYNVSGVAIPDMKPIVAAAVALFKRYRQIELELGAAKAGLDERRAIEKAKAVLMRDRGMTEPEAYRWLRKRAMNESRKLVSIAMEVTKKDASDAQSA
jgi:response regulator NasT